MSSRLALLLVAALVAVAGPLHAQPERPDSTGVWDPFWRVSQLGVTYGYASTTDAANAAFGNGREWAAFVNQRLWKFFGARMAYGNIGLGEATDFESAYLTALDLFGQSYSRIGLTIEYFSLGPSVHIDLGSRNSLTLAGSYGWYTVIFELTDTRGRTYQPRKGADGWALNAAYSFWPWEKTAFRFQVDYHTLETTPTDVEFYYRFTGGEDPRVWSYQFGIAYAYGDIFR